MTAGVRGLEGSIASIAGFRAPRRAAPVVCEGLGGASIAERRRRSELGLTGQFPLIWLGLVASLPVHPTPGVYTTVRCRNTVTLRVPVEGHPFPGHECAWLGDISLAAASGPRRDI